MKETMSNTSLSKIVRYTFSVLCAIYTLDVMGPKFFSSSTNAIVSQNVLEDFIRLNSSTTKISFKDFIANTHLKECSEKNCRTDDISNIDLSNLDLRSLNFYGSSISNCKFINSNLDGASFRGSTITNTSFNKALLDNSDFALSKLSHIKFDGNEMRYSSFREAKLNEHLKTIRC